MKIEEASDIVVDSMQRLQQWVAEYRNNDAFFIQEELTIDFLERICTEMSERNLKKKDLADKLGVRKSKVKEMLRGENLTLEQMVSLALALRVKIKLELVDI